jgi:hypothetical protein
MRTLLKIAGKIAGMLIIFIFVFGFWIAGAVTNQPIFLLLWGLQLFGMMAFVIWINKDNPSPPLIIIRTTTTTYID